MDDFNDSKDSSKGNDTTIRDGEPSTREKYTVIPKPCKIDILRSLHYFLT